MLLLLRVGAVFQQRRPEHGDAERGQRLARADRRHLLAHDLRLLRIETATAIFLRPMRHGPALVAHPLEPDALRIGCECGVAATPEGVFVRGHRPPHLRRAIGLQPGAGFAAKLFQIGHVRFHCCPIDLSPRMAEFNMSVAPPMRPADVAMIANPVYAQSFSD